MGPRVKPLAIAAGLASVCMTTGAVLVSPVSAGTDGDRAPHGEARPGQHRAQSSAGLSVAHSEAVLRPRHAAPLRDQPTGSHQAPAPSMPTRPDGADRPADDAQPSAGKANRGHSGADHLMAGQLMAGQARAGQMEAGHGQEGSAKAKSTISVRRPAKHGVAKQQGKPGRERQGAAVRREPPPEGDLILAQDADLKLVRPGRDIKYTVRITNPGSAPVSGAKIANDLSGVLDGATFNNDAVADIGKVRLEGKKLRWLGDVPPGATVTVTFSVKAGRRGKQGDQKFNAVLIREDKPAAATARTSKAPADDPPPGGLPSEGQVNVGPVDIKVVHSSDPKSKTRPGKRVRFKVVLTPQHRRPGPEAGFDLDLTKLLDDASNVGGLKATIGTLKRAGSRLVWEGNLPAKVPATITFWADVNKSAKNGAELQTQVSDNYFYCEDTGYKTCRTRVVVMREKDECSWGSMKNCLPESPLWNGRRPRPHSYELVAYTPRNVRTDVSLPETGIPVETTARVGLVLTSVGGMLLVAGYSRSYRRRRAEGEI